MGTSSSSKGPKGGVSFDPLWIDSDIAKISGTPISVASNTNPSEIILAPANRFTDARRNFRAYINDGRSQSLQRSIRSYVRHGLGGVARASGRMKFASVVGARAFSLFKGAKDADQLRFREKLAELLESEHTTEDVISTIVDFILPLSGSVDEESCRNAMAEALSDLLVDKPDIDILNLPEEDIWELLKRFIEKQIVRQITFDIGQVLESDAINIEDKINRLDEIERFVQSVVTNSFDKVRNKNPDLSQSEVARIISEAVELTFKVFGGTDE